MIGLNVATESLFQQKTTIRKEILEKRKSQDPQVSAAQSRSITGTLIGRKEFQTANRILIYLSKDGEVGTDHLLGRAFELGKRVCVPVVDRGNDELRISELPGPEIDFLLGAFGVREPAEGDLNFVTPDKIDLVVVPGLAFDRRGGRIGYGKGYYDRLLSRLSSQVPRIALAFEFQVLDTVPQDENDIQVDTIITEKNTMSCSGI
ncbi:MAG: 5-formyltetrahydrofolate cyclo-ligase [Nitrospinota bacterium]|nr:5-formyltetrahydrofolate cyclo-ligase [Nitrospinota bacterium]